MPNRVSAAARSCAVAALLVLAACGAKGEGPPPPPPPPPITPLVLEPGAAYFSMGGKQQFLAARNLAGRSVQEIETLLDLARDQGTKLVRFHVTSLGGLGITSSGQVVESWAADWDQVFAHAEADGIHVIPVFGVWADFNDGSGGEAWHVWNQNPLNQANGGPAASPVELYTAASAGQQAWLGWLGALVARWQKHANLAAWEVFSELNLVTRTGMDAAGFEAAGIAFVKVAAAVVRAGDPGHRPVTASLSGYWQEWSPDFYATDAVDIVQLHLYSPRSDLDGMIASAVGAVRALAPNKPILIGESGLDWAAPDGTTATTAPEGPRATRHAVWAALVSGAMDGRALWWEDAYAILQNNDDAAVAFVTGYPAVERGALTLLAGRDLAGMRPLGVASGESVFGGAIGDAGSVLGWFRAASCQEASAWDCSATLSGESVDIEVPGTVASWQVTFHDAETGEVRGPPVSVARDGGGSWVIVPLPPFTDDIAFELTALP